MKIWSEIIKQDDIEGFALFIEADGETANCCISFDMLNGHSEKVAETLSEMIKALTNKVIRNPSMLDIINDDIAKYEDQLEFLKSTRSHYE